MASDTTHTEPRQVGKNWLIEFTTAVGSKLTFTTNTRESALAMVGFMLDRKDVDEPPQEREDEIERIRAELEERNLAANYRADCANAEVEKLRAELAEARDKALDEAQEAVRNAWEGYGVSLVRINDAIRNLKEQAND